MKTTRVSSARVYQMIDELRENSQIPISREEAAYLLAWDKHINLYKYLNEGTISKLRELRGQVTISKPRETKKIVYKPKILQFAPKFKISDSVLPVNVVTEAKEMMKIYPYLYVFENSVRWVIIKLMGRRYGKNWWESKAATETKKKAKERIEKEEKYPWHGKRGQHPIFYVDIKDLKNVVNRNWGDFKEIFNDRQWFEVTIKAIELSRNIVAHHNPLSKSDIDRIKINFTDWEKLIASKKSLIEG